MISKLSAFAAFITQSIGWRRNALAFAFGVCATLTLAPFLWFPLIIPAFSGLYLLVDAAPTRQRAFADGWWWGWGFYMTGLYWFCVALLTDAAKFAWLIPLSLFALTGIIALYCGVACWFASYVRGRGWEKIVVFSIIWMGVEYARGQLFSGFPWNLEGYAFNFSNAAMQPASLIGVYGLTWLAVLLGTSAAALFPLPLREGAGGGVLSACMSDYPPPRPSPSRVEGAFVLIVWSAFALAILWGGWRLRQPETSQSVLPPVMLRLVQGNVAASDAPDPLERRQTLATYIRLTQKPGLDKIAYVIWPESSVPFLVQAGSPLMRALGQAVPPGTILITGALRSQGEGGDWKIWNSMLAIDHSGAIVGAYDKIKLVPFGEFLPLRSWLPASWLTPVGNVDFSSGGQIRSFDWPGLPPLRPLICYEAIFPELSQSHGQPRPRLLLNITNDAWFGDSIGPHQHFQMARMRAVEQGIPLVRAANTGISAMVDGYGRVVAFLPLGRQGVLDIALQNPQPHVTTYATYGDEPLLVLILIAGILIFRLQKKPQN